ncbi:MAG: hypothetical protein JWM98_2473, partial [Thermoleophilia bacterium]|nr:hypothetical protein [Thermoleophilia bacterium]
STYAAAADTVTTGYRADIGMAQTPASYSGIVTYTAVANP